jgi:two-component system LytT family response regulator
MRILVIDDEPHAIELIKNYLKEREDIDEIRLATDGFDGLKEINEFNPEILFLDIQMPKISGIELLELIDVPVQVIFTTAYDEYAIRAFELNATDYLLKPFSKERFNKALDRAKSKLASSNFQDNFNKIVENYNENKEFINRVVVKSGIRIVIIPVEKIYCIESADDYVVILSETGEFVKNSTMKYFEKSLNPNDFVRVHRSTIINVNKIKEIQPYSKENFSIILNNGKIVRTSRQGIVELKKILDF